MYHDLQNSRGLLGRGPIFLNLHQLYGLYRQRQYENLSIKTTVFMKIERMLLPIDNSF